MKEHSSRRRGGEEGKCKRGALAFSKQPNSQTKRPLDTHAGQTPRLPAAGAALPLPHPISHQLRAVGDPSAGQAEGPDIVVGLADLPVALVRVTEMLRRQSLEGKVGARGGPLTASK